MNTENIQNTIDLMKHHAEFAEGIGFDMGMYVHHGECGTTCCLAGFAMLADTGKVPEDNAYVHEHARTYLGLDQIQASKLFVPHGDGFYDATLDQGIAVMEHLKETGKVDWLVSGLTADSVREKETM